jgi:hypothetical protein
MKKFAVVLSLPLLVSACAYFQKDPDAGEPVTDTITQRSVDDVVACLTQLANRHDASFKSTAIPQGQMLDFGDSNIIKVRHDNGATTYRFYAGKRHVNNLWIESAGKTCAP